MRRMIQANSIQTVALLLDEYKVDMDVEKSLWITATFGHVDLMEWIINRFNVDLNERVEVGKCQSLISLEYR